MDLLTPTCRFVPSARHDRTTIYAARLRAFCAVICVIFVGLGCAHETQERPSVSADARRSNDIKPSSAPFPDDAFEAPKDSSRSQAGDPSNQTAAGSNTQTQTQAQDRFATRSLAEGGGGSTTRGSGFHGTPVDVDLKQADIHDVFRLLADVGKVNIVVADSVSGNVTLKLKHVPWDQVMDVVARTKGFLYEREGNVITVRAAGPAK